MTVALFITLLALLGVCGGILLGHSGAFFSSYLAAIGGGLLAGISLFWLLPEAADTSGWLWATLMTVAVCIAFAWIDHLFVHSGSILNQRALASLLAATAIHSFIDGWSVSALENIRIAKISAPLGLALHKIPEGVAVGWITRQRLSDIWKAALVGTAVELVTLVGAGVEPAASRSGFAAFGSWWTSGVIALIGGSFLFLGVHAVLPNRRGLGAVSVFVTTFLVIGAIGLVEAGRI
jgi:zinc transporter ZupT